MTQRLRCAGLSALVLLFLPSCNNNQESKEITETRTVAAKEAPADPNVKSAERFGAAQTAEGALSGIPGHEGLVVPAPGAGDKAGGTVGQPADDFDSSLLRWTAPANWKRGQDRMMREVTFQVGAEGRTECYVSVLRGEAGGVEANVNRWRTQMNLGASSPEEVAALPRIEVLGQASALVEATGDFAGMAGATQPGAMLLGVICEFRGRAVFVKMVGPEAEVRPEKDNFVAFCQSLKYGE